MQDKIKKVIIGIRYRRSFRVPDIAGEIVDYVLHDESSPFDSQFFTEIGDMNNKGRVLLNQNGNMLSVDFDSIVLTLIIDNKFDDTLKLIKEKYYPYMVNIVKQFEIKNFNRIGIIFDHQLEGSSSVNEIIKSLTGQKITAPDNLELRFSKKLATTEALWKKDIIDYHNVIATYHKNSEGLNIKLDYQTYFSPEISSINDLDFSKFIESAEDYRTKNFYSWNKTNDSKN